MDLPRLMLHAQQIEAEKGKKKERANNRARTRQFDLGQSRSQNSMSGKPNHPQYAKCGKNHGGEYLWGHNGCYGCGQVGHGIKECPHARLGNRDVRPQTQANCALDPLGRPAPPQGTSSSTSVGQCQN
ncbi:uncharacterized protein LOC124899557 [Capsicum annuum]|uniref:uncharacterized protein LOC124899557 n=1 Tax=Capsicum annuum TaxID=4072 RepID=UPI001FB12769|nr:uncharacterized protein LOC124899557 [Capsicum annuum]